MRERFTIYCARNTVTGKSYIGQTKLTLPERWRLHVASSRGRRAKALGAAIRTHGPEAFVHEVLDVVTTPEGADAAERAWIAQRNTTVPNGYNIGRGGRKDEVTLALATKASTRAIDALSDAERSAFFARRGEAISAAKLRVPAEQRSERQRVARARQVDSTTHEQRSAAARKAWETKRSKPS